MGLNSTRAASAEAHGAAKYDEPDADAARALVLIRLSLIATVAGLALGLSSSLLYVGGIHASYDFVYDNSTVVVSTSVDGAGRFSSFCTQATYYNQSSSAAAAPPPGPDGAVCSAWGDSDLNLGYVLSHVSLIAQFLSLIASLLVSRELALRARHLTPTWSGLFRAGADDCRTSFCRRRARSRALPMPPPPPTLPKSPPSPLLSPWRARFVRWENALLHFVNAAALMTAIITAIVCRGLGVLFWAYYGSIALPHALNRQLSLASAQAVNAGASVVGWQGSWYWGSALALSACTLGAQLTKLVFIYAAVRRLRHMPHVTSCRAHRALLCRGCGGAAPPPLPDAPPATPPGANAKAKLATARPTTVRPSAARSAMLREQLQPGGSSGGAASVTPSLSTATVSPLVGAVNISPLVVASRRELSQPTDAVTATAPSTAVR